MKGFMVAGIWTVIILAMLYITHPMWLWSINSIMSSAGGDQVTVLLAQLIFIILVFGVIVAIWFFRGQKEEVYRW